jgi:hypothetical protein
MRSGASFPSWADQATWSVLSGTADPLFPPSNLADLASPRSPAAATDTGALSLKFVLPAARSIRFVGLIHHNAPAGATLQLRLYSDAAQTGLLYDTGSVLAWPAGSAPVSGYPAVRPIFLPAAVTALSGRLDLAARADGTPWAVGGVELSGWYEWQDVAVPRAVGFDPQAVSSDAGDGVAHVTRAWSPRQFAGTRELVDQSELETTALDFQREKRLSRPFVWAMDLDDPATWARECALVVNERVPPGVVYDFGAGRSAFAFREHLG